jgi:hypothetical protein
MIDSKIIKLWKIVIFSVLLVGLLSGCSRCSQLNDESSSKDSNTEVLPTNEDANVQESSVDIESMEDPQLEVDSDIAEVTSSLSSNQEEDTQKEPSEKKQEPYEEEQENRSADTLSEEETWPSPPDDEDGYYPDTEQDVDSDNGE